VSVDEHDETLLGEPSGPPAGGMRAPVTSAPALPEASYSQTGPSRVRMASLPGTAHTGASGRPGSLASVSTDAGPSMVETLKAGEIDRTRFFLGVAMSMSITFEVALLFLQTDPVAAFVVHTGSVAVLLGCGWLMWMLHRDEANYTAERALAVGYCTVYGAFTGVYFFGAFSPGPIILPFGLFFFSLSQSFRGTLSVYLTCAIVMMAMFVGDMTDTFATRGYIRAGELGMLPQLLVIGLVQGVLLSTFLIGRASRTAQMRAIEQHGLVMGDLVRRQALLDEARHELERALRSGGLGRYSNSRVGSFRLGKVLGRGAMGEVYEAVHAETGEPAAVKLLQVEMLRSTTAIQRFLREAEIASSLSERHVVKVLEVGGLDAAIPFIAMERLEGTDLSDHLRQHTRLSLADAVRMARHVAEGLRAARKAGIVHRDLKPANLFYARLPSGDHVWKVLDFGVSKLATGTQGTLTQGDALIGTPEYMAPEQPLGRPVSHRTDVYALGVICYRALTGTPPFAGEGVVEVLFRVVHDMPPMPSAQVPALPAEIDAVLALAMAKDPADRFEGAEELAAALAEAAEGRIVPELAERAARVSEKHPWSSQQES
jgi:eukaryotic-like serine/threonine-protein kinase